MGIKKAEASALMEGLRAEEHNESIEEQEIVEGMGARMEGSDAKREGNAEEEEMEEELAEANNSEL